MEIVSFLVEVHRQLIEIYNLPEDPNRPGSPLEVPDGEYSITFEGSRYMIRYEDDLLFFQKLEEQAV